jgi:hypothetical protein
VVAYRGYKLNPDLGERSSESLRGKLALTDSFRFLVVSHDRGGAEVIADFVTELGAETRFVTAGPARNVFAAAFPERTEVNLEKGLDWADTVIVATGWQTDWELSAQAAAQSRGLRTAVVLDNWVNFSGRFKHHGYAIEPMELWVVDTLAAQKAEEVFPESITRVLPWSHYDVVVNRIILARAGRTEGVNGRLRALFLGENVQDFETTFDQKQDFGFSQFDALAYVDRVFSDRKIQGLDLRLRPHPSEKPEQYQNVITSLTCHTKLSQSDLITDLAWCDIAVGLSSIALYYASRAGVLTCTCFPVGNSDYHLSPWGFPTLVEILDEIGWPAP